MVKGNPRGSHSARRARYALLAICCGGLYWMYSMTQHSAVLAASTDELLETAHGNIGGGGGLDGRAPPRKQLRAAAGRQGGSRQRNILWPDPSDMPPEAASVGAAEIALQKQTHIVFSTGCEKYHDWQSVGMFYSARRVTPFAPVTRLLSCLTAENEEENRILHGGSYKVNHKNQVIYTDPKKRAAGQYHLTPLYSPHPKTGDVYLPYFKSASMTHWFASAAAPKEPIVICVDPDFVMMRDIDMKGVTPETLKGKPIAMNYKTEQSCWGVLQHLLVEKGFACAECKERLGAVSFEQAKKALATGPPYVAHRDDWVTLAPRWKFYTEVIRDHARDYAGWIADMCSHGLAVIDLGLDQQLRGDWMTTGPIVLDESGQTSNAIAGPGTADAPNTDYFWRKGNWDPAAETFAVPPYTLHYDQKLYNVGMMWQWAKKTRAYRHDDVLECGRRFQPPPARHGLEESGAHWYIGHVMAELNAALDWYGERVYGKARNAACVLEQKEWARESYQPRVLSVMPKGAKNAYTIFTDKGKELQHGTRPPPRCLALRRPSAASSASPLTAPRARRSATRGEQRSCTKTAASRR